MDNATETTGVECGNKTIYDPSKPWQFKDSTGAVKASYFPQITVGGNINWDKEAWEELSHIAFTRVYYISRFNKPNRTPRLTWAYGQINSNIPVTELSQSQINYVYEKCGLYPTIKLESLPRSIVFPDQKHPCDIVDYRGLTFESELMPFWLEKLALHCRQLAVLNWGFETQYNSCILGKYEDTDDSINFHTDDEVFLAHHFCANVTLGYARDFQFKDETKAVHEIKLGHKSVFFFLALEHALPKRAAVRSGEIRYSISFRNMQSNVGIGNSFYYCRGVDGAINNERKLEYQQTLAQLQNEKQNQ